METTIAELFAGPYGFVFVIIAIAAGFAAVAAIFEFIFTFFGFFFWSFELICFLITGFFKLVQYGFKKLGAPKKK